MGNFTKISPEGDIFTDKDSSFILEKTPDEEISKFQTILSGLFGYLRNSAKEIKDDLEDVTKSLQTMRSQRSLKKMPETLFNQIDRVADDVKLLITYFPDFSRNDENQFLEDYKKQKNIKSRFL